MFLHWKNQYCENDYTSQSNLQIQYHPYQIINDLYHRTRAKIFTIRIDAKGPPIAKAIFKKKNKALGIRLPDFRLYYKAIVSRQYGTSTKKRHKDQWEKGRKSRDRPMHLWAPYL